MARRRQFLSALAGGAVLLAGCSESTDSGGTDSATPGDRTVRTSDRSATETATIRPDDGSHRLFETTDTVTKDGDQVQLYTVTADSGVSACLQTHIYETYSGFHGRDVWKYHNRLHVGLGPNATIEHVDLAYENEYYPPSQPYGATSREVIPGEERGEGIAVDIPISGDVQDVSLPLDLVESLDDYRVDSEGTLVIPYDNLVPNYLARPLHSVHVTTTRSEQRFLLQVPQPSVSMTVQDVTTSEIGSNGLVLQRIAADVMIDSRKPTQYVNLHTNFGGTESYDYGRNIEADDFTAIDGGETTRIERDFTRSVNSIDENYFDESYPIERLNFDVVLGQVAPLASEAVSADRFIP